MLRCFIGADLSNSFSAENTGMNAQSEGHNAICIGSTKMLLTMLIVIITVIADTLSKAPKIDALLMLYSNWNLIIEYYSKWNFSHKTALWNIIFIYPIFPLKIHEYLWLVDYGRVFDGYILSVIQDFCMQIFFPIIISYNEFSFAFGALENTRVSRPNKIVNVQSSCNIFLSYLNK